MPPADVQDPDGAREVSRRAGGGLPRPAEVRAGAVYRASASWVSASRSWVPEVVGKRPGQATFEAQPTRWVVERAFGWPGRYRRLSKGYEHNPGGSEAWAYLAMTRRLARNMSPRRDPKLDLLRKIPRPPKP